VTRCRGGQHKAHHDKLWTTFSR